MILEEQDWRILVKAIGQQQCVLLLGPGVATDPTDPNGEPLSERLAKTLAEKLRQEGKGSSIVASSDLAHVAQIYEREMRGKRPGLELAVDDFYSPYKDTTTQLHRDLAALPFSLCVSTTPERFLLNALKQREDKNPKAAFYHFKPNPKLARSGPGVVPPTRQPEKEPLVYDLYGSLVQLDSLVLTENDLLDFLVSVIKQAPPLHSYVTSQFSDPAVSFLFLGFGFRHWYVRILLHVLKTTRHSAPSLALEDAAFFALPGHQETALFFQSDHLIEFRQLPWADFTSELRRRYEEQAARTKQAATETAQLPENAPVAFLCHENRDKPKAEELSEELAGRGIKTWLDIQNLRGGDDWPKLIPGILKKTDYVVVLQSPRMLDKRESYFFLEIDLALQRQPKFRPGARYLIPTILEHDSEIPPRLPLDRLGELHNIDLTEPNGIDALADTIWEDWAKTHPDEHQAR
jgi:hypothetical protein